MDAEREVLVVGGGPAGSATALLLAQAGLDVVLLDAARFPRDKVCGEAISPGGCQLLDGLGVTTALRRAGARPVAGMRLTSPEGVSFEGVYDGGRASGFALDRRTLDAILLERARAGGVEVHEGVAVTGLAREGATVVGVRTGGPGEPPRRVLRARLVVGADGRRSVVARTLGLLREARRPRRFAVRGYWEDMDGLSAFGEMHVGGGGYCGIAPLGARRGNVTFVLDQKDMTAAGGDLEGFYRRRLISGWPRIAERLSGARLLEPPRAVGPLALESTGAWAPGVLLVGDAAGFFDPFTGEGIAAGLRAAERAAAVAVGALRGRGTLAAYGRAHRELVAEKFRFNRRVQWLVGRERLSNAAARILRALPGLANRLVDRAGDCFPARAPVSCRMASPEGWRAGGRHRRP
jgi:geranylgeranyl reductase family protein